MLTPKKNNGIAKARPNGDTPLSLTPNPISYVEPMGDAPRPSDWSIQAEKERKLKSQKAESYLMQQAESKKKNK
jgi:hypothetical protein